MAGHGSRRAPDPLREGEGAVPGRRTLPALPEPLSGAGGVQSVRRVRAGSTPAARSAGPPQARAATAARRAITPI